MANACTPMPPIEWPTRMASCRSRVSSTVSRSSARLSIEWPDSPTLDSPWPRASNATARKPAAGNDSNCLAHTRDERVTPWQNTTGGPSPRLIV